MPQRSTLLLGDIVSDFLCPQGVRLLSVYISADEYLKLAPNAILIYEGQEATQLETDLHPSEVVEIMKEISSECNVKSNEKSPEDTDEKSSQKANASRTSNVDHQLESLTDCKTSTELKEELIHAMEGEVHEELDCPHTGDVVTTSSCKEEAQEGGSHTNTIGREHLTDLHDTTAHNPNTSNTQDTSNTCGNQNAKQAETLDSTITEENESRSTAELHNGETRAS